MLSLTPKQLSTNTTLLTKRDVLQTSSQSMTHLAGQHRLPLKQKFCFNTFGKANYHGMNLSLMTVVKDGQAFLLT